MGYQKIHYLGLLGKEEKSLVGALPSQTVSSIQTDRDEQNEKYISDVSCRSWMTQNIFLKAQKGLKKGMNVGLLTSGLNKELDCTFCLVSVSAMLIKVQCSLFEL